jgi:virulence-associated protein VapD
MNNEKLASCSEIKTNPFIYNAPLGVVDFYNREEIIEKLLKETATGRSQGNVWVTGERQVGKTSLLKYIDSEYGKFGKSVKKVQLYRMEGFHEVAFIYLNIQDNKTRDDFYRNLRQSLKDTFDFKIETKDEPFQDYLEALKHLYVERCIYTIFLIDEFDAFIENLASKDQDAATSFIAELNRMIQGISTLKNEPKVFGCVFTANHTIEDLMKENEIKRRGSGLVVESMELPWFDKLQIEELAHKYLKGNPIQFLPEEIDFCFKMTQGYPYFVQKLFYLMYNEKSESPGQKNCLKRVRKEYGDSFRETIKGWGGANMPKRTLRKLKDLAGNIMKEAGDTVFSLILKMIEEYIKNAG